MANKVPTKKQKIQALEELLNAKRHDRDAIMAEVERDDASLREVLSRIASIEAEIAELKAPRRRRTSSVSETVEVNATVILRIFYAEDDAEECEFKIVSSGKVPSDGELTTESPIGKAIFGKKAGDEVTYTGGNGRLFRAVILSVR